ncbi:MAG TPA: DUF1275 family protein [Vitreimonas sp.]|uniref:YoaK family protein n=1 Tax=Vitreimonas sp. TaxID=3069702 RepID=UPI002D4B42B8|nr:DUF1275 family protein [Vitreimonas sp.]HYD86983.1 DUF1275 family protein [Vitreimonas sp.]
MIRYQRRYWLLAAGMSAVAGFVDAIAFVQLGGFFVSFMSGNSTRLGVGLAGALPQAALAASLIAAFVAGVVLGAFINRNADERGGPRVLVAVAALLALAAALASLDAEALAIALLAVAMGAENAVFHRDGEVSIGVTYMTGTLVKLGQRLAAALRGGEAWAWLPYFLLWLGLALGAACGAAAFSQLGLDSIWIAAAAAALLAVVMGRVVRMSPRSDAP